MRILEFAVIFVSLLALPTSATQRLQFRPLLNQNHLEGASCSFWLGSSKHASREVLHWDLMSEGWINIGSSDVKLAYVKPSKSPSAEDKLSLGAKHVLAFSAQGIRVIIRSRISQICRANESCEAWHETGEIQVIAGGHTIVSHVQGICGS